MKSRILCVAVLLLFSVAVATAADAVGKRAAIDDMAEETLDKLFAENEGAKRLFKKAEAYAVFDNVKVALLVSGGGGVGVAVDKASDDRTYMKMGTGGVGLGVGGQSYQLVILFETDELYRKFIDNGWQADTSASAVAGTQGKNLGSSFTHGVAVYQFTNKGLMASADVSGTKFWKHKKLNR